VGRRKGDFRKASRAPAGRKRGTLGGSLGAPVGLRRGHTPYERRRVTIAFQSSWGFRRVTWSSSRRGGRDVYEFAISMAILESTILLPRETCGGRLTTRHAVLYPGFCPRDTAAGSSQYLVPVMSCISPSYRNSVYVAFRSTSGYSYPSSTCATSSRMIQGFVQTSHYISQQYML
jgi:hypothetical protein